MVKKALAFVAATLLGSHSAAAEFVVLSSTQESVAAGSVIADDQKISLAANRTLQLIDQAGRTITLNGPHEGVVKVSGGEGKSKLVRALSSLIREYEQDAHSVGAIRAADKKRIEDTVVSQDDAMVINISETGDYCLAPGTSPKLVRYHSETGDKVTLTAVANGASQALTWPKTDTRVAWPSELTAGDGERFLVSQEGKDTRTLITLHEIESGAPTAAHLAVTMIAKDCTEQARLMLVHIRRSAQ